MPGTDLRSLEFRRERESAWRELEEMLQRVEGRGLDVLDEDELYRLPVLYRGAVSSLSVARAISLDRALVAYLDNLAARAYVHVYGTRRGYLDSVADFFATRFPATVWRLRITVAVAVALLLLGAVCGYQLTRADPERYFALLPAGLAQGREPGADREELRRNLEEPVEGAGGLTAFAGSLFTHNARVGMLAAAVGVAGGVPAALLLFSNGLVLGAFAALHHAEGLGFALWAWLLPHGVTELLAACLCGAAGLALGRAFLFPGRLRRLDALAQAGSAAAVVVLGSVPMFLLAGLIEGYFRQLVVDPAARYALAAATALLWGLYFGVLGRRRA